MAVLQIGRMIGLAVATVVQTAVERGCGERSSVETARLVGGKFELLQGLRAAKWFDFGLAVAAFVILVCAFRGREKVGAIMK